MEYIEYKEGSKRGLMWKYLDKKATSGQKENKGNRRSKDNK